MTRRAPPRPRHRKATHIGTGAGSARLQVARTPRGFGTGVRDPTGSGRRTATRGADATVGSSSGRTPVRSGRGTRCLAVGADAEESIADGYPPAEMGPVRAARTAVAEGDAIPLEGPVADRTERRAADQAVEERATGLALGVPYVDPDARHIEKQLAQAPASQDEQRILLRQEGKDGSAKRGLGGERSPYPPEYPPRHRPHGVRGSPTVPRRPARAGRSTSCCPAGPRGHGSPPRRTVGPDRVPRCRSVRSSLGPAGSTPPAPPRPQASPHGT